jgi:hypothetical protein
MSAKKKKSQGFILLIVMAILAALILMVINLIETVALERVLATDFHLKTRSRLLALSGVEYAIASIREKPLLNDVEIKGKFPVSIGTYIKDGDSFELNAADTGRRINVNDGIKSGNLEASYDAKRSDASLPTWKYRANVTDPWPGAIRQTNLKSPNKSGLNNLRLRRLLNAYGDVHISQDKKLYEFNNSDVLTVAPTIIPAFRMTSSAIGSRGDSEVTIGTNLGVVANGLGDIVILKRPQRGYRKLADIKSIVNTWAREINAAGAANITPAYYTATNHETFFHKVSDDLTVLSFEDDNFYRLRTEIAATFDPASGGPAIDTLTESPHMWLYQNDHKDTRFRPSYLDRFPIDLRDDSGNGTRDPSGAPGARVNVDNNLFAPHSVALINLNVCSREVAAAVFYAPVNVSYQCEGALTHSVHKTTWTNFAAPASTDNVLRVDMGMGRSSIGVRGPCFDYKRMTENGVSDTIDSHNVQVNRLMSLKDAMLLTEGLMTSRRNNVAMYNFDDFKKFLTDYRKEKRIAEPTKEIYERAHPIPLKGGASSDRGTIEYELSEENTLYYDGDPNKKVRGIFHNKDDSHDTEFTWVSQYWQEAAAPAALQGWAGGWFLEDYVERTLPHIFSCVRRIPGYLGAPLALTSPYMIVEPFAYVDPNQGPVVRDQLVYNDSPFITRADADNHLGRQPKISVEDLVSRHAIPKVCFLSNGIYELKSIGRVNSGYNELIAQTTIEVTIKLFDTRYYRTQAEFVSVMARNSGTGKIETDASDVFGKTHEDILIGPEFKIKDTSKTGAELTAFENRVQSKYWLTLGLADANSQAGKKYTAGPLTSQPYMPSNPDTQPHASGSLDMVKAWDVFLEGDPRSPGGGLDQSERVTTILPQYGSKDWQALLMVDTRPYTTPAPVGVVDKDDWSDLLKNFLDHLYFQSSGGLPGGLPRALSSDYERVIDPVTDKSQLTENLTAHPSWGNPEFMRKSEDRLLLPHGMESVKEHGMMENSKDYLWSGAGNKGDGHDMDPFGGGIFFSSSANGEFCQKNPNPNPEGPNPINPSYNDPHPVTKLPGKYIPHNFRDTLYWPLNNKLKNFDTLSDIDGDGKVNLQGDDQNPVNGILDVYDFENPANYPFNRDEGDVNPVGVGFHRGFSAAWFRVPTSYPFPHPFVGSGGDGWMLNKNKLFKTIMSLHLINQSGWISDDNDNNIIQNGRCAEENIRFVKRNIADQGRHDDGHLGIHLPARTGHHDVDVQVGYYSGFNSAFGFEHGIVGHYRSYEYYAGVMNRGSTSTKYHRDGYSHPLALAISNVAPFGGVYPRPGPFYNRAHGYFWDYDHLRPTPYKYDGYTIPQSDDNTGNYAAPPWGGGNVDMGYGVHTPVVRLGWVASKNIGRLTFGPYSGRYIPYTHMMWKQDYGEMAANQINTNFFPTYTDMPINNILYSSHADDQINAPMRVDIKHELPMNKSAECAPGSWHRIYAFWFMRFNPGQMGMESPGNEANENVLVEMGDSSKYSTSTYWETDNSNDSALRRVASGGNYPDGNELPFNGSYKGAGTFPAGRSRYADDDASLATNESDYHNTNAALDVDGLDQFGVWFRDDSNYSDLMPNTPTQANRIKLKPTFLPVYSYFAGSNFIIANHVEWRSQISQNQLTLGAIHQARINYDSISGEPNTTVHGGKSMTYSQNADLDRYLRIFPAYRLDSVVDDFIFGYGSDISVPLTSNAANGGGLSEAQSSYFRGLFHNAHWLADPSEPYNRHADEVRYDIRSPDHPAVKNSPNLEVKQPHLSLNFSHSQSKPEIPDGSRVLYIGSRLCFPRDTLWKESATDPGRYNSSELNFDVYENGTVLTDPNTPSTKYLTSSKNKQDHFFTGLTSSSSKGLFAQFKYTGYQREFDASKGQDPLIYQSTIYNHNQNWGDGVYVSDKDLSVNGARRDRGDSFTNIPYILELSIRYANEIQNLRWIE